MISLFINLGVIFMALKILTELFAVSPVAEGLQQRLRDFFERWQEAIEKPFPNSILIIPFSALAKMYDRMLGQQPFSWPSFRKTSIFGFLFVGATLGFAGVFCGKPFAMNVLPWESYSQAITYLKIYVNEYAKHHHSGDPLFIAQNVSDLTKLDGWPYELLFTIYFIAVVVFFNTILISLSISISRLFLREMLIARTVFGFFVLFLSNTVLLLILAGIASVAFFILLNAWSWPFVPLLLSLSKISMLAGLGVVSVASLCSWFFSGLWLKVVVVGSLLPSLILVFLMGIGLLGSAFSRSFRFFSKLVINLSLRSPKGIFSFTSAVLAALAFTSAGIASLWGQLSSLSSMLLLSKVFGVDYLIVSLLSFFVFFLYAWLRASHDQTQSRNSSFNFYKFLFLFFVAQLVICLGFYIEQMSSFLLPSWFPPPDELSSNLAFPAISSIIPGGVVACFFIISCLNQEGWVRLSLLIFIALTIFDALDGLMGSSSYRDTAIAILCDLIGAPVAAVVLKLIHSTLQAYSKTHYPVNDKAG